MKLVDRLDLIDDRQPRSAAMNMALDEALLHTVSGPTMRTYRWEGPAVSFGYFSAFREAELCADGRELVRRWTGGGIVLHGADLTYSVIVPRNHSLWSVAAPVIYANVHAALKSALAAIGIHAALANSASPPVSDACFANPVRADLVFEGRKIAGAAQRKTRIGILQQGSVQAGPLPNAFPSDFAQNLADSITEKPLDDRVVEAARVIAQNKYGRAEWLMRR